MLTLVLEIIHVRVPHFLMIGGLMLLLLMLLYISAKLIFITAHHMVLFEIRQETIILCRECPLHYLLHSLVLICYRLGCLLLLAPSIWFRLLNWVEYTHRRIDPHVLS
jgi:hypothetical protein